MNDRKRIDMSSSEFFYTAVAVLLLGVLVGWGLFSVPNLGENLVLDNGNVADWLAAGGTWVIGFGAWKYARESHQHNVRHAHAAREQQLEGQIVALQLLTLKVVRLKTLGHAWKHFDEEVRSRDTLLRTVLRHTIRETAPFTLSDPEKALLTVKASGKFRELEIYLSNYVLLAELTLEEIDGGYDFLASDVGNERIATHKEIGDKIDVTATQISDLLIEEGARFSNLLREHRAGVAGGTS